MRGARPTRSRHSAPRYRTAALGVVLTGTDLYRDLPASREAQRSLALADRLVVLQELASQALPAHYRDQDHGHLPVGAGAEARRARRRRTFDVAVVGHLRDEKDPLTAMRVALAPARRLARARAARRCGARRPLCRGRLPHRGAHDALPLAGRTDARARAPADAPCRAAAAPVEDGGRRAGRARSDPQRHAGAGLQRRRQRRHGRAPTIPACSAVGDVREATEAGASAPRPTVRSCAGSASACRARAWLFSPKVERAAVRDLVHQLLHNRAVHTPQGLPMNAPSDLKIKLTSFSHGGGCGCKIAPGVLGEILKGAQGHRPAAAAGRHRDRRTTPPSTSSTTSRR